MIHESNIIAISEIKIGDIVYTKFKYGSISSYEFTMVVTEAPKIKSVYGPLPFVAGIVTDLPPTNGNLNPGLRHGMCVHIFSGYDYEYLKVIK